MACAEVRHGGVCLPGALFLLQEVCEEFLPQQATPLSPPYWEGCPVFSGLQIARRRLSFLRDASLC